MIKSVQCAIVLIVLLELFEKTTAASAAKLQLQQETLACYNCSCSTTTCPCSTYENSSLANTYCIIQRQNFGQSVFINSGHVDIDSTVVHIREFPYVLVEETITYDERVARWFTSTDFVIYGCNWNLCNKPELVPLLPTSFQMRLPEAWLNSSILGTGQPVRDCHECPDGPQCGTSDFLDPGRCPIESCNTTCLVSDTFNNPEDGLLCYQSYCAPPDSDTFTINPHRVEIEGVIYASQQNVVELWEIDLFCRADDCSRPEIFKELREQLYIEAGSLPDLFNETHDPAIPQRRCYDCYCRNDPHCPCNKTVMLPANSTHCTLVRENIGQDFWISFEHNDEQSTRIFIREFPYILIEESIIYSEQTERWNTITNFVVYGCNWDYCNHPSLVPFLPSTFQMRLPETWLNDNILGTGQPVRECHECRDGPQCGTTDFLDPSRCPIESCNTTCLVSDTVNDPEDGLLCYQSFCASPDQEDLEIDRHRVEIEGVLYLNKYPREVQLWEIDLFCRADDCSRPELFNELRSQLTLEIGNLGPFDTVTSTTAQSTMATSTMAPSTTTSSTVPKASAYIRINLFNILLISILLFNFQ